MRLKASSALACAVTAGILVGIFGGSLWSSERPGWRGLIFRQMDGLTRLDPVRVLPRAELAVSALQARAALQSGQPWKAWRLLRDEVDAPDAAPTYVLLASRAAADWGGWENVRRLLHGRDWLAREQGGEGLFLLARSQEELGDRAAAAASYRRYLASGATARRGVAQARLGRVLMRSGAPAEAARAFAAAATALPEVDDWMHLLQVEALVAARAPGAADLAARSPGGSAPVRMRRARAEEAARMAAGDSPQALQRLGWEERVLRAQGARAEAAQLEMDRAKIFLKLSRPADARDALRRVAWESGASVDLRLSAARMLGDLNGLTAADEMARATAYEAAGQPGLAARSLRGAMTAGAPRDAGMVLKLARLLYQERDLGPARDAFRRAAGLLTDPEMVAEAQLYAARSLYIGGGRAKWDAIAEFKQVAERYPTTAAAATSLLILGEASSSMERGLDYYRRAAAIADAPDAREALYRVGDRYLRLGNPAAALRAWSSYMDRYPTGEASALVAYRAGRVHEGAGRRDQARAIFRAGMRADPVSYYAFRSASRVDGHPVTAVLEDPRPWPALAADEPDAQAVLRRLDALEDAGLDDAWTEEMQSAVRGFGARPAALLSLAEGLRDRLHTVEAIRIGRSLLTHRNGEWDARLLRVIFPFPYRDLLTEEARRYDFDPALLAGLVRQESSFRADARSHAGAVGLGQIMPATGAWLARTADVRNFDTRLLEVPEISLRMGAAYLHDLLTRYDGEPDLALAAYNAGPSRADRWLREFGHENVDAFRDAIPFSETRQYVRIVLRNAAVYSELYGDSAKDPARR
jgi:soluble lytic murein transglycosylase